MPSLEKATITNTVTGDRIPVHVQPRGVHGQPRQQLRPDRGPGPVSAPLLQFVHGNMQTLEMELLPRHLRGHSEGSRTLNQAGDDVRS